MAIHGFMAFWQWHGAQFLYEGKVYGLKEWGVTSGMSTFKQLQWEEYGPRKRYGMGLSWEGSTDPPFHFLQLLPILLQLPPISVWLQPLPSVWRSLWQPDWFQEPDPRAQVRQRSRPQWKHHWGFQWTESHPSLPLSHDLDHDFFPGASD
jgi:hypothetical protein